MSESGKRVAVFGAGSWGTAFAMILADAGCEVTLWARRPVLAETIHTTRINPDYLPDMELPASVRVTSDVAEAARGAEFTVERAVDAYLELLFPGSRCSPHLSPDLPNATSRVFPGRL